jgi:hypothetical protein
MEYCFIFNPHTKEMSSAWGPNGLTSSCDVTEFRLSAKSGAEVKFEHRSDYVRPAVAKSATEPPPRRFYISFNPADKQLIAAFAGKFILEAVEARFTKDDGVRLYDRKGNDVTPPLSEEHTTEEPAKADTREVAKAKVADDICRFMTGEEQSHEAPSKSVASDITSYMQR